MAKKAGKLASRYARALLTAVAKEGGSIEEGRSPAQRAAASLNEFAALWESDPKFSGSMLNPIFDKGDREKALLEVAKRAALPDIVQRFLRVCFERDRISQLPEIAFAFSEAADAAAGLKRVEVTTARNVSQTEKESIEKSLAQHLSGSLEFTWREDASILGGLIVRFGGKVLDGSVGGKLARVETRLRTAS